jgi:hypothetical protein
MSLIEPCDALYVSARAGEAELACPARIQSERERGLRVLVVTLFDSGTDQRDALFLGLSGARDRDPRHDPWAPGPGGAEEESWIADTAAILDDVFVRARPRHLYLPLGVGGFAERRVAHDAARRTFQAGAGRDIFFYEERPEAFVSGSVRIRLGLLGARLPPAGSKIAGEGGMLRFLLRFQTVPRVRGGIKGLGNRIRCARLAAGQWRGAKAWRPQRAMGPRLQPVLHDSPASALEGIRGTIRATIARAGLPASADRMVTWSEDYARRLGQAGHAERYWLLLPNRDEHTRAVVPQTEGSAIS